MPQQRLDRRMWWGGLVIFALSTVFLVVQTFRSMADRSHLNADVGRNTARIEELKGTTREAIKGHEAINRKLDELLKRTEEASHP